MRTRHMLLGGALLLCLPALAATAQDFTAPGWSATPRHLETYWTRMRLHTDRGPDRESADGPAARFMWSLPADPASRSLASRAAVGLAAAYAEPSVGPLLSAYYVGAEGDLRLLPTPIAGRLDPYVTLGAGALNVRSRIPEMVNSPDADRELTSFAVTPGAGARLHLGRGLSLRGDVRDLVVFRDGTRHNPTFGVGLALTF